MKKNGSRLIIGWRQVSAKTSPSHRKGLAKPHVRKRTEGAPLTESNIAAKAVPGLLEEEKT